MNINRAIIIYDGTIGLNLSGEAKKAGLIINMFDVRDDTLQQMIKKYSDTGEKGCRNLTRKKHQAFKKDELSLIFIEADLIIECTEESLNYKKTLFKMLDQICDKKTIFVSNSFPFNLMHIALETSRPAKVVGFNVDPGGNMVEVIKNISTAGETVQVIKYFAEKLNKKILEFEDFPADIVHYIIMPMINEAVYCLMQGVINAEETDILMRVGANLPIGPLALADLIGLDECKCLLQRLYKSTGDYKFRPCPLFEKYVEANWLGCKTGRGFHSYDHVLKDM